MTQKIGLVYLNRNAEGKSPVRRFINSYKLLSPGIDHEFITLYKGFTAKEMSSEKGTFADIEHRHVIVDDNMTDIDSYLIAAKSFPDVDVFCFLNTFSEIACKNWLLYLHNAILRQDVGIAGATASYESLLNSLKLISKVAWFCDTGYLRYDRKLHIQYKTYINLRVLRWVFKNIVNWLRRDNRFQTRRVSDYSYLEIYEPAFEKYWKALTAKDGIFSYLEGYPPFPNPNVRTNGFIVRRDHLLPFFNNSRRMTKNESYLFESGIQGLTHRIRIQGLKAIVVNNCGDMFDVDEWPESQTFRLGQQKGLLIRDNQTRAFEKLHSAEKELLAYMTWGTYLKHSSGPVFTFGIPFGDKKEDKQNEANK